MRPRAAIILLGAAAPGALALALALPAAAAPVTAIVEDVRSANAGVQLMDYLEKDQQIRLAPGDRITLSYLANCARETIVGGVVTVGAEQSTVTGGRINRTTVPCSAGNIMLKSSEAQRGGAWVSRSVNAKPIEVHATQPLLELKAPGELRVQRTDKPQTEVVVNVTDRQLVRGRFLDFSLVPIRLEAGGTYMARMGDRGLLFKLAPRAQAKPASIVSRLLIFPQ